MNALIQKVAARKQQKASSASAGKGKAAASEVSREEVPVVTVAEAPELPPISSRKRRAPETPRPHGQSASSGELGPIQSDAVPLQQIRSDSSSRVLRCRSNLFDMYREDLRIVGAGPTPLGGALLRDVVSTADTEFLDGLSWSDLVTRSNSTAAEAALLYAELAFRATNFRRSSLKETRAFRSASDELEGKIAELREALEKERANSKRREEDMREGFAAEARKLKNEMRLLEVRLDASKEEARATREELSLAQKDAASARADLQRSSDDFKDDFMKSEEFSLIVAEKALNFIYVGFDGAVAQFKEAGYPPEGSSADFLDAQRVVNNLPPEAPEAPEV